jgi:hypothetical protein
MAGGPGKADFWLSGAWNATCDLCGAKNKSSRMELTWNGLYTCRHHKERRNAQDFLRGVKDDQSVPWSRPYRPPLCDNTEFPYVQYCTLQGRNAIPGFALPGCAVPSFVNTAFYPTIVQYRGWAIQDTYGCDILDTNGQMIFPPNTPSAANPPPPGGYVGRLDIDFYLDVSILG